MSQYSRNHPDEPVQHDWFAGASRPSLDAFAQEAGLVFEDAPDHIATGSESLREFAENFGMDHPDQCWLLDSRDVWVRNPFYHGPPEPHPEDDRGDQFTEWKGDSDGSVGCD